MSYFASASRSRRRRVRSAAATWGHEAKVYVDEPCSCVEVQRYLEATTILTITYCRLCQNLGRVIREAQG